MKRAYYSSEIAVFLNTSQEEIIGVLSGESSLSIEKQQTNAWKEQINILKEALNDFKDGHVFFEFSIPRMGKRTDNIVIINNIIFVLEFKVYAEGYLKSDEEQVVDYARDLENFHKESHNKIIIPIVIATTGPDINVSNQPSNCLYANKDTLKKLIRSSLEKHTNVESFDISKWYESPYSPTPTIVEAARCLYAGHNVNEISRTGAGEINLTKTTSAIINIIQNSKKEKQKSICFLTGVPGSGKTLAGLNIATSTATLDDDEHAVFLSGNGPLVKVLQEALARDEKERNSINKKDADRKVKAFIQNIHHFRDDGLVDANPPHEKVVIFDEAQRAWDREKAEDFMRKKKNEPDFHYSEPEFLIKVMDRHRDWCVIICLIGHGQEINTGEAGVTEWFKSLNKEFSNWHIYYPSDIKKYINIDIYEQQNNMHKCDDLYLAVSLRSFRSEKISEYIENIISNKPTEAKKLMSTLKNKYPIFITRDLATAKKWIKGQAVGSERYGIVASSNGIRLKPEGIDVKNELDTPKWFLNPKNDVRSSFFLEYVASEFDAQGLELDWVICAWDINLRRKDNDWQYCNFSGTTWKNINNTEDRQYLLNSYRVLLTRARQGMVIFVPHGNSEDWTRKPQLYDDIHSYLVSCGIMEI